MSTDPDRIKQLEDQLSAAHRTPPVIVQQQQQTVVVPGYRVPHMFHLFMSVITLGLWLPIWGLHWLLNLGGGR